MEVAPSFPPQASPALGRPHYQYLDPGSYKYLVSHLPCQLIVIPELRFQNLRASLCLCKWK